MVESSPASVVVANQQSRLEHELDEGQIEVLN